MIALYGFFYRNKHVVNCALSTVWVLCLVSHERPIAPLSVTPMVGKRVWNDVDF